MGLGGRTQPSITPPSTRGTPARTQRRSDSRSPLPRTASTRKTAGEQKNRKKQETLPADLSITLVTVLEAQKGRKVRSSGASSRSRHLRRHSHRSNWAMPSSLEEAGRPTTPNSLCEPEPPRGSPRLPPTLFFQHRRTVHEGEGCPLTNRRACSSGNRPTNR